MLIQEVDADANGAIDFNDFLKIMSQKMNERDPKVFIWKLKTLTEKIKGRNFESIQTLWRRSNWQGFIQG